VLDTSDMSWSSAESSGSESTQTMSTLTHDHSHQEHADSVSSPTDSLSTGDHQPDC